MGETSPASVCTTTLLDLLRLGARLPGGRAGTDEEGAGAGAGGDAGAGADTATGELGD